MASIVGNTSVPVAAAPAFDFAPGQGGQYFAPQPAAPDPGMGYAGAAPSNPQNNAFNSYLDSTGYQFQFDQGQRAITGSADGMQIVTVAPVASESVHSQELANGAAIELGPSDQGARFVVTLPRA